MPEYLSPGVYLEEVPSGVEPIDGVPTSVPYDWSAHPVLERPSYFSGKVLTTGDFEMEQSYHREKRRLHNRLLHGWGIVWGLSVAADPSPDRPWGIRITPGLAVTATGDELLVRSAVEIDLARHRSATASVVFIAVRYVEVPTRPTTPGHDAACDTSADARIQDAVAVGLLTALPASHRPVGDDASLCDVLERGGTTPCLPSVAETWVVLAQVRLPASASTRLGDSNIDVHRVRRITSATGALQAQLVACCCKGERCGGRSPIRWIRVLFGLDRRGVN
jgi:hypothetical protein